MDATDALARLKEYSGQIVAVQLRTPMFMLQYGGRQKLDGQEHDVTLPAVMRMKNPATNEDVVQDVGFSQILPVALLEVRDHDVALKMLDPNSGAELQVALPADEILYVTKVTKSPSTLLRP